MKKLLSLSVLGCVLTLSSCLDDKYDLSDLDTTIAINFDELQIPLNLDEVELDAILDLEENSQIKKINGEYVIQEEGTFESDPISVPTFSASVPAISPIEEVLRISEINIPASAVRRANTRGIFSYELSNKPTTVSFHAENVDKAIISVESICTDESDLSISIEFDKAGKLVGYVDELTIEDLVLNLIPGLNAKAEIRVGTIDNANEKAEYNPETGQLTLPKSHTAGHKIEVALTINEITKNAGFTFVNHTFDFQKECNINSGYLVAYKNDLNPSMLKGDGSIDTSKLLTLKDQAKEIDFICKPAMTAFSATKFSGEVEYDVKDVVKQVKIDKVPDIFAQEGTDVVLDNPQLYLTFQNPLWNDYQLSAIASLTVTSFVDEKANPTLVLDEENGSRFFALDKASNKFCMSPVKPENDILGNSTWRSFSQLSRMLSGKKIPNLIEIVFKDPKVPAQSVKNFRLGEDIDRVTGEYNFYAPLALTENATINYVDTIDGLGDDLEDFVISHLKITSEVFSEVPIIANIKFFPIDKNGNKIMGSNGQPICGETTTPITKGSVPLNIELAGEIKNMEGLILNATIKGETQSGQKTPLKPNQKLKFGKTHLTLTGVLSKEL